MNSIVRLFGIFLLVVGFSFTASSQSGSGTLKGVVSDMSNEEPMAFANIVVFLNGNQVAGTTTDFDGKYSIKPINPGSYDVEFSFIGYTKQRVTGVKITSNKIRFVNAELSEGIMIAAAEVIEYEEPLIDRDGGASGGTVGREEIDKMPGRSATSIATTVAGVGTAGTGGGISIRGARPSSTWIYIDGVKVRGSSAIPKGAIEEVQVITGGVPANIGDATGGIINISLRNASSKWFGGGEVITSGLPIGDELIGLDQFGYNLVEGVAGGPILMQKDSTGARTVPFLGLFVSGNYTYQKDPRPTFGGINQMTAAAREEILANPLRQNISSTGEVNGALYNADFLTSKDFYNVPTRSNVATQSASLVAKMDVLTNDNTSLTFGLTGSYNQYASGSYATSLMNWDNHSQVTNFDWRAYVKFAQRFNQESELEEGAAASSLKNVYYQVMADYTQTQSRTENPNHGDKVFRYGHVGTFDVNKQNSYEFNPFSNRFVHNGWEDTLVTYTPTPHNQGLAAINNQYFQLFEQEDYNPAVDGPYESLLAIQNGNALLNGQSPADTYGIWSYVGAQSGSYGKSNNTQFRISAHGSGDIGDHAIQMGFEYEQRRDAYFSLAPLGLWTLGRLTANSHLKELNLNDSTISNVGTNYYVTYGRLIGDNQFEFDRNLRLALELDPDGNDFINIDAMDPDALSLSFFGADDLLNQGDSYVGYSGYDPHGNKLDRRTTLEDFFNETNAAGYHTRPIQAYEPIYIAGYVMDKFTFDDIIFNVGVRVDRFDANQQVLKDPYVIGENYTVGDTRQLIGDFEDVVIPENMGDDFAIYVDAFDNPTTVVGYRDGDTWFNSEGAEINDPDILAVGEPYPAPWLKTSSDAPLTSKAFRDYDPQVNIMPRVSFSFNISDEAVFFAHYDILTQRPTSSNRFSPIDYLFIRSRDNLISNPDLRPEKTIDYEMGFQQVLTPSSSLKISAFYKEMRDMIQVRNFTGAHPRPYRAYGNLDFGTVKGLTVAYDLRRTGNVRLNASYTLQFADGTGSTTTTALALINAGLPNLRSISPFNYDQRHRIVANIDYRYGSGGNYNGPVVNLGKDADGNTRAVQLFANAGMNFIANLGSGTPYTASTIATPITGGVSPSTEGSINGSRLPWQFSLDMNMDKNWTIAYKTSEEEGAAKGRSMNLNVYVWVGNLLNTRNINSVYRFTGIASDDGYLAAAQYQPLINSQTDPESYKNYYSMYVNNPFNLGLPRTVRLGVKFDF